ncbi:MAG: T9SS type A sorting domain-containing protein [Bacteroidales bacterium]|jgi:hypothetical protein|nr:T9SS type A sorting domain-containing protein [Bacteroidales bacterium]
MKLLSNIQLLTGILLFFPGFLGGQGIIIQPRAYVTVQTSAYVKTTGSAGMTIQSTSSGTGSLIDVNGGITVSGTSRVERYISHNNHWHFLSSPVTSATIWPDFAPIPTGPHYTFGSSPWYWDFFYWNPNCEPWTVNHLPWVNLRKTNGDYNNGTIDLPEPNAKDAGFGSTVPPVFQVGRGYLVAYTSDYSGSTTHNFTGTLNYGNQNVPVTYYINNSWELTGNPYPSAIDWKSSSWGSDRNGILEPSGAGFDYWIFNDSCGNYGVCNSVQDAGTNGTTRYISPMQGFFVKAATSATEPLPFTSSVQTHSTQTWLKEGEEENNLLRLNLTTNATVYSDEMIITVNSLFENGGSMKLWSLYAEAPEIYSVKNDKNYSIYRMPCVNDGSVVNLGIKAGITATYTLTVTGLKTFFSARSVNLEDLKTGVTQNLNDNNVYTFSASPDDQPKRLLLRFGGPYGVIDPVKDNPVSIYASEGAIVIHNNTSSKLKGDTYIYDLTGRMIRYVTTDNTLIRINMDGNKGYYFVTFVTNNEIYNGKVFLN